MLILARNLISCQVNRWFPSCSKTGYLLSMPLHATTLRTSSRPLHGAKLTSSGFGRTIRVRQGPTDWCLLETWRECLLGSGAPDWYALEVESRARCIKKGQNRTTWRVAVGDRVVFVKAFDCARAIDRLKQIILGGAAEREWRASLAAVRRGVAVAAPLAIGVGATHPPVSPLRKGGRRRPFAPGNGFAPCNGEARPPT